MPEPDSYLKWLAVRAGTDELRVDHVWRAEVVDLPGAMACSPDGARVATIGPDGACSLWDRLSGALVQRIALGVQEAHVKFERVTFHPDGRQLFLGCDHNGQVLLADGESGRISASWGAGRGVTGPAGIPSFVRAIQVGGAGNILAIEVGFTDFQAESWTTEMVLVAWDVAGEQSLWHLRETAAGPWSDFRVAQDEQTIQVVQAPDVVSYDAQTGEERARLPGSITTPSPCGRLALALTGAPWRHRSDGCRVVSIADGAVLVELQSRNKDKQFTQCQFVPGAAVVLFATSDGFILHGSLVPRTMLEPDIARPDQATGQEPTLGSRP